VSDQYLPYHFFEDPSMPPVRALKLLHEWKDEELQKSYTCSSNTQRKSCAALLSDDFQTLTTAEIKTHLQTLRRDI